MGGGEAGGLAKVAPPPRPQDGARSWEGPPGEVPAPTSRESPEMTRAQSCFLRKAFSSRWASPRLVTWKGTQGCGRPCSPQNNKQ